MEYTCKHCGNKRFFYNEISVQAKQRIDLKNGARHGKTYDIDPDLTDNYFEPIYCGKCDEPVDMEDWKDYTE